MKDKRNALLEEVRKIVCQDRNDQYAEPEDSFKVIAEFWSAYLGIPVSTTDVGNLMVLFKIAREKTSGFKSRDSFVDAIGYALCAADCAPSVTVDSDPSVAADSALTVITDGLRAEYRKRIREVCGRNLCQSCPLHGQVSPCYILGFSDKQLIKAIRIIEGVNA